MACAWPHCFRDLIVEKCFFLPTPFSFPKSGPRHQETEAFFSSRAKVGDSQGRGVAHVLKMVVLKYRAGGVMSRQGLSGKLEGWLSGLLLSSSLETVTFAAVWGRSVLKDWPHWQWGQKPRRQVSASSRGGGD